MLCESKVFGNYLNMIKSTSFTLRRNYHLFQRRGILQNNDLTRLLDASEASFHDQSSHFSSSHKIVQLKISTISNQNAKVDVTNKDSIQKRSTHSQPPPPSPNNKWKFLAALMGAGAVSGVAYYINQDSPDQIPHAETKKKYKPRPFNKSPENIGEIPDKVPYLLIGGGTASFSAFKAIKTTDPKAKVLMISEEDNYPYMRPPLSKEIWANDTLTDFDKLSFVQWNGNKRSLYYEPPAYFTEVQNLLDVENGGLAVARGYKVTKVNPEARTATVTASDGTGSSKTVTYGKCLIATGITPKNIQVFSKSSEEVRESTILLRTIRDLEKLWHKLESAKSIVIVGGSFLGSEIAVALARKYRNSDKKVIQIFREAGNMSEVLPEYLSNWTSRLIATEGVDVYAGTEITNATMKDGRVKLELSKRFDLDADVIIVGAGCKPRTELAQVSGLEVDRNLDGFVVNADMAARNNLYVAGDVASYYDIPTRTRRRNEHHDHAVASGRTAGRNMADEEHSAPYTHRSMFWSDLGPRLGYEAIGLVDASMPTVAVFANRQATTNVAATHVSNESQDADSNRNADEEQHLITTSSIYEPKNEEYKKYSKGVVFYLSSERKIVGVLMWNVFNRMHIARQLLSQDTVYEDFNDVAKLFNLHND